MENNRLVKTKRFDEPRYIGDPLNAVRIYNEKYCDELVLFDIGASAKYKSINYELLSKIASVSNMPLCYGGGIDNVETAEKIIHLGFEKVSLSSAFLARPLLIEEIAKKIGSQSVVVTIDVAEKRSLFGAKYTVQSKQNLNSELKDPLVTAKLARDLGAGEIIFNSVSRDGLQNGYDLDFVKKIKGNLNVPLSFLGGCGELSDMSKLLNVFGHCGCAAGSIFVYKGKLNGILISYPSNFEKQQIIGNTNV
jgi:cyclase